MESGDKNMVEKIQIQHEKSLNQVRGYSAYYRHTAEKRFLLIKEFEIFMENEAKHADVKRRKMRLLKIFCEEKEISSKTFCRHLRLERQGGIEALVPKWGKKQGKNLRKAYDEAVEQSQEPVAIFPVRPRMGNMKNSSDQMWAKLRIQYAKQLHLIRERPDFKRIHAEKRFLLIKEFEIYVENEAAHTDVKRRKMKLLKAFCEEKGISSKTFCRHLRLERQGGIEALVPEWGGKKGKRKCGDSILPIIKEMAQPGKGVRWLHDELMKICSVRGINAPRYHTVRRMCIEHGLLDLVRKKKNVEPDEIGPRPPDPEEIMDEIPSRYRVPTPKWLKVPSKRAFNVGMYKYSLVAPFLDPELSRKDKKRMIAEVIARKHYPSPGVTLKISRQALMNYISIVREYGCEGLFRKEGAYYDRRYKNFIWSTFKINMKDPLGALGQLRDAIERGPKAFPDIKEVSLTFFDRCLAGVDDPIHRYKRLSLYRPLSDEEKRRLERYKMDTNKNQRAKAKALLMADEHYIMPEIAFATERSPKTIYRWFGLFKKRGIDFIKTKPNRVKYDAYMRERKERIIKILHTKPMDYDINKTEWVLEDIAKVYEREYGKKYSTTVIRRAIKQAKYSWRRAKKVLTSPDPEFREKTKKVLDTLRNLKPNEAFFFIDEGGPYAVKKYGGKSLTPKGTQKTYPQFQKTKGSVTFIGGLDAVKNQIILFFTKSKDTGAVIALIRVLFYRYHQLENLYLTWDAASWHRSKALQKFLDVLNSKKDGPKVKVVPLPNQSQFLNVIEAVFGGMKRAVIFNSDYVSEHEMKVAIVRHFRERNEFFKANPKRAGKKIWDREHFDLDKLESGLYKRM